MSSSINTSVKNNWRTGHEICYLLVPRLIKSHMLPSVLQMLRRGFINHRPTSGTAVFWNAEMRCQNTQGHKAAGDHEWWVWVWDTPLLNPADTPWAWHSYICYQWNDHTVKSLFIVCAHSYFQCLSNVMLRSILRRSCVGPVRRQPW